MKEKEIERLFYKYGERVYRTAFRLLNNENDAKDVVQEVFVGLYNNMETGKIKNIGAYLGSCGAKKAIDFLRRARRDFLFKEEYIGNTTAEQIEMEDDIQLLQNSENYMAERIRNELEKLPDRYRVILSLRLIEDYGYREIAGITGLNESTIRSIYMRGRAKLIQALKKEGQS